MTKNALGLSLVLFALVAFAPTQQLTTQVQLAAELLHSRSLLSEYQPNQRPPGQRQVLADFRIDRNVRPPRITAATTRNVLSRVFRKYLTDDSQCGQDFDVSADNYLKAARDAGQIVPTIVDMASGSFTAAGVQETAYVISVNECGASHADNYGTKRIAVFSGQRLVMDADADFLSSIIKKTDLNGDGIAELLMTSGDMNQGVAFEAASLISLQNRRIRVLQDLGTVLEDSCASEMPGSASNASVISVNSAAPGSLPTLRIDNYRSGCKRKRWRFISTGKMQNEQ